jgi:hypothetical protein
MINVLKRIALAGAVCLAFVMPAEAAQRGSVYLMRGLANVFSLGLDTLNDKLHARGVQSVVINHAGWSGAAEAIKARYRSDKNALPVVLMGHSFGADATLRLANALRDDGIPVALIVDFDVVNDLTVPSNVRRVVNFYASTGNGLPIKGAKGFRGRLENIDVSKIDSTITHLNIEKSPRLHSRAVAEVLRVLGR